MPTHKKLLVLQRLTALIEQADYSVSLVGSVFRGRQLFDDQDPTTMVSLLEGIPNHPGDVVPAGMHGNTRKVTFDILCQGWTKDDPVNPTDPIYALLGAVEAQLSRVVAMNEAMPADPQNYMLGKLVSTFIPAPGVVRPPEQNISTRAFFYIPIRVEMPFDLSAPFVP